MNDNKMTIGEVTRDRLSKKTKGEIVEIAVEVGVIKNKNQVRREKIGKEDLIKMIEGKMQTAPATPPGTTRRPQWQGPTGQGEKQKDAPPAILLTSTFAPAEPRRETRARQARAKRNHKAKRKHEMNRRRHNYNAHA